MAHFPTTRWTLIQQAVADDASPAARQALESLCQQYAAPVLGFLQHRMTGREQAEDIAQGFFAQLIERNLFDRVDKERGRFRTFLLHALRGYMADVHDYNTAQKRGGGQSVVSLQAVDLLEPQHELTPECQFELQWVRTLLSHALQRLESECEATDKAALFQALRGFLDAGQAPPVNEVAEELKMSQSAVRVAVHRLRKQLGRIIRDEIAETVQSPSEVDDELSRLMQILENQR